MPWVVVYTYTEPLMSLNTRMLAFEKSCCMIISNYALRVHALFIYCILINKGYTELYRFTTWGEKIIYHTY